MYVAPAYGTISFRSPRDRCSLSRPATVRAHRYPAEGRDHRSPAEPSPTGPVGSNPTSSARGLLRPTEQPPSFHETPRALAPSPEAKGANVTAPSPRLRRPSTPRKPRLLSNVLNTILRSFGRQEALTRHPNGAPGAEPVLLAPTSPEARTVPAGEQDRALALLTVLGALAPVSRATFLALRDVTNLPDVVLLRALQRLADAGLATVEEGRTGQSTLAFSISDPGREVLLGSPHKNGSAPKGLTQLGTA